MALRKYHPRPRKTSANASAAFKAVVRQPVKGDFYVLTLYVTGSTPRSSLAVANLRKLCHEFLSNRHRLEVVDIYQMPNRAVSDQIVAAPTLIKSKPSPVKRLIGDLSNREKILSGLNLASGASLA